MKKQFYLTSLILLLTFGIAQSQIFYPAIVYGKGIITAKYQILNSDIHSSSEETVPIEVSVDDVKSFFALNVLFVDYEKKIKKGIVARYTISIYGNDINQTIKCEDELFSNETKKALSVVSKGDKIYFEFITASEKGFDLVKANIISFVVI